MAKPAFKAKTRPYFRDLRDFISLLEETGNLHRISARIEKNSELMPLVRWQYQGLPDNQRKAFLFDNVTDPKGRNYDCKVAVGVLGARVGSTRWPLAWKKIARRAKWRS